jgi:formate-dependent nitrite reductase membrane component NrfD
MITAEIAYPPTVHLIDWPVAMYLTAVAITLMLWMLAMLLASGKASAKDREVTRLMAQARLAEARNLEAARQQRSKGNAA